MRGFFFVRESEAGKLKTRRDHATHQCPAIGGVRCLPMAGRNECLRGLAGEHIRAEREDARVFAVADA